MMQQNVDINYHYDSTFDSLNIYLSKANYFYSDETDKGIYLIRNEETEELIGVEILYFSQRNVEALEIILNEWNISLRNIST